MLGLKSCIIDTLGFLGGQCNALYAEKPIYDIAGYPSISAEKLIENLIKQAEPFKAQYYLNQQCNSITKKDYLTGVDGVVNLYSSFYVPGDLKSVNMFLNYSTNYPMFVSFGNVTVYSKNATGDLNATDPLLGALNDNGGFVYTRALSPTSPAINSGTSVGCPVTDARGYLRVGGCDRGAFEYVLRLMLPLIRR